MASANPESLLPRSRYDEGLEILKTSFEGVAYGDPTDMAISMIQLVRKQRRK